MKKQTKKSAVKDRVLPVVSIIWPFTDLSKYVLPYHRLTSDLVEDYLKSLVNEKET